MRKGNIVRIVGSEELYAINPSLYYVHEAVITKVIDEDYVEAQSLNDGIVFRIEKKYLTY
jgi:hypothetical protein